MLRGAWWASVHGVTESDMTEQLCTLARWSLPSIHREHRSSLPSTPHLLGVQAPCRGDVPSPRLRPVPSASLIPTGLPPNTAAAIVLLNNKHSISWGLEEARAYVTSIHSLSCLSVVTEAWDSCPFSG